MISSYNASGAEFLKSEFTMERNIAVAGMKGSLRSRSVPRRPGSAMSSSSSSTMGSVSSGRPSSVLPHGGGSSYRYSDDTEDAAREDRRQWYAQACHARERVQGRVSPAAMLIASPQFSHTHKPQTSLHDIVEMIEKNPSLSKPSTPTSSQSRRYSPLPSPTNGRGGSSNAGMFVSTRDSSSSSHRSPSNGNRSPMNGFYGGPSSGPSSPILTPPSHARPTSSSSSSSGSCVGWDSCTWATAEQREPVGIIPGVSGCNVGRPSTTYTDSFGRNRGERTDLLSPPTTFRKSHHIIREMYGGSESMARFCCK